jgi:hypothetical protein
MEGEVRAERAFGKSGRTVSLDGNWCRVGKRKPDRSSEAVAR